MANVALYNMNGEQVGTIDLNDDIFGLEASEHAMHMAVVQYLANTSAVCHGIWSPPLRVTPLPATATRPSTSSAVWAAKAPTWTWTAPWTATRATSCT